MSKINDFYEEVKNNPALFEKLNALNEQYSEVNDENIDDISIHVVNIAREYGYDFTAADFRSFVHRTKSSEELSDEQLEAVAGGEYPKSCVCAIGGGGKSNDGTVCACVLGGFGEEDSDNTCIFCVFGGGKTHTTPQ
jgi:predicted ribosomally synthesized peptide with nif11-like leader